MDGGGTGAVGGAADPGSPSRRAVLRSGAAGGVLAAAGLVLSSTAACARRPEGPDELEAPLAAARGDAALATSAGGAFPELAGRLAPVADARRTHADVLAAEIRRARPDRAAALDASGASAATGGVDAAAVAPAPSSAAAALAALRESLGRASTDGRTLALRVEPHRCGLLASVAAGCAGHRTALA